MYFFKEQKKAELLDGRTIEYVAKNKVYITPSFLCAILKGRRGCSYKTAMIITKSLCREAELDSYFYEDKTKPMYIKADKK